MDKKPIKIHWVAPNGKQYEDVVNMSLEEYENFVNGLLKLKQSQPIATKGLQD